MAKTKPSSKKAAAPAGKFPAPARGKDLQVVTSKAHTQRLQRPKAK